LGPSSDTYRLRLEGRAELLEAGRRRYQALLEALRARRWEEQLRERLVTLREVAASQAQVDAALTMALRRAGTEGWPAHTPTVRLLHEVQALRDLLLRTAVERLGAAGHLPDAGDGAGLMRALEDHVRSTPREVAPGQRYAVATEALPEDLLPLRDAVAFGERLRSLFAQPFDPARPLPFKPEELEALRQRWPEGTAALSTCWARLDRVDPSGGVVGEVRKLAKREPHHAPRSGPEQLARAGYWFETAGWRLEGLVRERLALLPPRSEERLEVAFWLCERGGARPEARLRASATVGETRAGLLELAHELWEALHAVLPEAERWPEHRWERMLEAARRAGPVVSSAEASGIRNALRTFILARSLGTPWVRGWSEAGSLEEFVRQARDVARAYDGG
jgi:hypothetical protein